MVFYNARDPYNWALTFFASGRKRLSTPACTFPVSFTALKFTIKEFAVRVIKEG